MARRAALVLVALLVVAASAAVVSRWSGRGVQPTFTPSYTSTTTPAQTALAPVKRVQLSPNSSIISALFVGDKLVFMNYTDRYMEGGVNYTKVLLHVLDLKTLSMESTVELESMPISPPESVQCEKRTIFGLKRTTPEYRLLGYDGRYAYVSRYCPGEGPGYPVVYAVDTSAGVIYKSTVNAYEVAALKDGVVYYIGGLIYSMG
ncbi:MAG: hypothetical protein F7B95_03855, partial [Desulfurococcales archaeon]|nr:hypothetical protein [Desulfurococcales archaeon]